MMALVVLVEGVGDTINEALPTIGAAVGYAMGGPTGAVIGSGLGTYAQGGNSTERYPDERCPCLWCWVRGPRFWYSAINSNIRYRSVHTRHIRVYWFWGGAAATTQGAVRL